MGRTRGERRLDLIDPVNLDLDLEACVRGLGAAHGLRDAACNGDMIVLDQHAIVEPHAMVLRTAHPRGELVEDPEAGNGLARVEQHRPRAGDRIDILARERGDTR